MIVNATMPIRRLIADILRQHLTAAADEIAAVIDEEIEARVQDRVTDLRAQLEPEEGGLNAADAFIALAAQISARMRAIEKRTAAREAALAKRDIMFASWRGWRHERVEGLLNGPHGTAARELAEFLGAMTLADAPALLTLIKRSRWGEADADTRFE